MKYKKNQPKISLLLFILTFVSAGAYAQQDQRPECISRPYDPFDLGQTMPSGKYKGKCIDTSKKRPAIVLSDNSERTVIANFLHQGKWWIAAIPRVGVERVIFQIEKFPTGVPFIVAAHTQIRFEMKPGAEIELLAQDLNQSETPRTKVSNLVFSMEYAAPQGVEYDIFHGEFNEYASVERILSEATRGSEQILHDKNPVEQYPLIMSTAEANRILHNAVLRSDQIGLQKMYNTLDFNCTTEAFDIIDAGMDYPESLEVRKFRINILNFLDPVDGPSIAALKERELISELETMPTLNQESLNGRALPR